MRYNDATNTANTDASGYHHTITLASMGAAADCLDRLESGTPLHVALRRLMASDLGHPDWLLAYWERDTLFSVQARRGWIEPDRAPLPFSTAAYQRASCVANDQRGAIIAVLAIGRPDRHPHFHSDHAAGHV